MRKIKYLVLTLAFVLVAGSTAWAIPSPTYSSWTDKSRDVGSAGNAVRVLKLVRFASQDQTTSIQPISAGEAVVYDTVSDDGITVRRTTTSADNAFAGIAVTQISSSDSTGTGNTASTDAGKRNWGWIIVHGPATANALAGATNTHSVGDPFITSRDAGNITSFENTTTNNNVIIKSTTARGGFFMDAASGSATTYTVFVEAE